MSVIMWLYAISMGFGLFMLVRNHWVYSVRSSALNKSLGEYYKLTSYDNMLWRFWIWDVEQFKAK